VLSQLYWGIELATQIAIAIRARIISKSTMRSRMLI
jgi:hypothetical protein